MPSGLPPQRVVVQKMLKGTTADVCGVREGDELVGINGQLVSDMVPAIFLEELKKRPNCLKFELWIEKAEEVFGPRSEPAAHEWQHEKPANLRQTIEEEDDEVEEGADFYEDEPLQLNVADRHCMTTDDILRWGGSILRRRRRVPRAPDNEESLESILARRPPAPLPPGREPLVGGYDSEDW